MNKDTILGFVRHLLTFGGGFLVTKGWSDAPGAEAAVGAIITLIGFSWSIVSKMKAQDAAAK
jgi:hypothetical protein